MNIPQVNALATDRNRGQTRWICKILGWIYTFHQAGRWIAYKDAQEILLPNGSFTLDQVVGMLEAEGIIWRPYLEHVEAGWYTTKNDRGGLGLLYGECLIGTDRPHDLTAAMDARIKALEARL